MGKSVPGITLEINGSDTKPSSNLSGPYTIGNIVSFSSPITVTSNLSGFICPIFPKINFAPEPVSILSSDIANTSLSEELISDSMVCRLIKETPFVSAGYNTPINCSEPEANNGIISNLVNGSSTSGVKMVWNSTESETR